MIDTHCHVDQYPNPESIVSECERTGITTVAVTGLPSHYELSAVHLQSARFVFPALGYHPLLVAANSKEIDRFEFMAGECPFIGEIGIDGSKEGKESIQLQIQIFERVVSAISSRKRFVTLHSRGAVDEVLAVLRQYAMYPVVFHWFSGSKRQMKALLDDGHYISINPAMTESMRWQSDISYVPLNRILTETDGPYSRIARRPTRPEDVSLVLEWLANKFRVTYDQIETPIDQNFQNLRFQPI